VHAATTPTVGQQWFVVPDTSAATGETTGTFRLVNRYSGLVLALTGNGAAAQSAPGRTWDAQASDAVDTAPLESQQTVSLIATPAGGRH
jgi:hypothetical protein